MAKPRINAALDAEALTDATDWTAPRLTSGFHANGAGLLNVTFDGSTTIPLQVNAGQPYPYSIVSVVGSGSTATGVVVLYTEPA